MRRTMLCNEKATREEQNNEPIKLRKKEGGVLQERSTTTRRCLEETKIPQQ